MKSSISLKQLQALAQVAQHRSFTGAAKALGVSQPTVSNLVHALEKQYRCKLLDRSGPDVRPTELFDSVFGHVKAISALSEELDAILSQERDLNSGRLTIGYSTYQVAMPLVSRFIIQYPKVTTTARAMASHDLLPLLFSGVFDIGLITGKEIPSGLDGIAIAPARIGLVMPTTHAFATLPTLGWHEVSALRLLQREPTSGTRRIFEAAARIAGAKLDTVLGLGSWGSILSLVREGVGMGVAFEAEFDAEDSLVFTPIDDANLHAHAFMVFLPAMRHISIVAQFIEIAMLQCDTNVSEA